MSFHGIDVDRPVAAAVTWDEHAVAAFSGGMDATCTVIRHARGMVGHRSRRIAACALIHGFDIELANTAKFEESLRLATQTLSSLGLRAIPIRTNYRSIARAHNQTEQLTDVTAHAEILALTAASNHLGSKYLPECTLYVTLEPCVMCAGALAWAQMGRVVYGASDEKRGFMLYGGKNLLHPKTKLEMGILERESELLLKAFFRSKR